ncbi:MAG: LytR C-terminal domain-containing protein [candidate division Zixibacteria bacterium]|nr:LytR C-terminal domain-containing protein [candidate division Zixibacteria bacterium]
MPIRKSSKKKKSKRQIKSPGFTGWAIIFLSVFIVVFLVSMLVPQSDVTVTQIQPELIRLQLKNGCGVKGAAGEMTKAFMESSTGVIFDIIDKGNAEAFNFEKTLVIDRKGDPGGTDAYSNAAITVADILNTKPEQLLLQKLSDNLLDIDVTVIIGADYQPVLASLSGKEE